MNFRSLPELLDFFKDEQTCRTYLENTRWEGVPECPYCHHTGKMYRIENGKRFKCGNKKCHKKFSVTVGTIFEDTKVPLRMWFAAIYLMTAHKKGISSLQLSRDLNITQKSAWFVLHRIREMLREDGPQMLKDTVEIDEVYIGGKDKNKHASKRSRVSEQKDPLRRGNENKGKVPVVGMVQRGGKVIAQKVWNVSSEEVLPFIGTNVEPNATIITDAFSLYHALKDRYRHVVVDHSKGEYVKMKTFHTNTIEGFWSLLKRGIVGIYHQVSFKHLNKYTGEFAFRYNTRTVSDPQRFIMSLPMAEGKRLLYRELTHKFNLRG